MPLQNAWYEPDKVFVTHLIGAITVEDLQALANLWEPMVQQYQGKLVHNITDVTQITAYQFTLRDLRDAFSRFERNKLAGWVVISGNIHPVLRFMLSSMSQLMGFKFRLMSSLEGGLAFLNEQDDSLPLLLPLRKDLGGALADDKLG